MVKFSAAEKKDCLKKLKAIRAQMESIEVLIGEKPILYGAERKQAQELMKTLKTTLRLEYRRTSMPSSKSTLTTAELHHYRPAVHQADCTIRVKYNSIPNAQWIGELYDARTTIEWYISGLTNPIKSPK